jgi:surface antigen
MCTAALQDNIWSNNGTATAAASEGDGWIETQTGIVGGTAPGGYQCTELATRYFYFKFGVCPWISGNAKDMCNATLPAGVAITTTPVHGDLVVLAAGCGGSDPITGHVAVVNQVGATTVSAVQEHSGSAGSGTYSMSCVSCFLHAAANTGAL